MVNDSESRILDYLHREAHGKPKGQTYNTFDTFSCVTAAGVLSKAETEAKTG